MGRPKLFVVLMKYHSTRTFVSCSSAYVTIMLVYFPLPFVCINMLTAKYNLTLLIPRELC